MTLQEPKAPVRCRMIDKRGCPPSYNSGFCADYDVDCDACWKEWKEWKETNSVTFYDEHTEFSYDQLYYLMNRTEERKAMSKDCVVCGTCNYCVPIAGTEKDGRPPFHTCLNKKSPFGSYIVPFLGDACAKYTRNGACQTCEKKDTGCMEDRKACIHPQGFVSLNEIDYDKPEKKTVVFDFDGVIHSYQHPYTTEWDIPDPPVPGIADVIDNLNKDFKVIVCSTRCRTSAGRSAVADWLFKNGIAVYGVEAEKPPAVCYVDDRAIRFDGTTDCLEEKIRYFKSWVEDRDEHGE